MAVLLASTSLTLPALAAAHGAAPAGEVVSSVYAQPAQTQSTTAAPDQNVVVTGVVRPEIKTIQAKRNLSVVSDGVSSEQIDELPEFGLGDALAAVPGVTFVINNGRGEDQFLTIRGLDPDYDSVTVDGIQLPSTEETTRSVSFDVLPSILVSQANVLKTWTVDQPSDATGGVTDLRTRSAFDHVGTYVFGQINGAYWEDEQRLHSNVPSGEGDLVLSKTFGPGDQFGALLLGSYYQRSSSTVNTYTLPYSYYAPGSVGANNVFALDQTSATASNTTLKPSQSVLGDIAIPDRHEWYFYDNVRTRPGVFTRLDFNDHHVWHAHLEGGVFAFKNDESRYLQYLNRVGPADITTASTGSFAEGSAAVQYDKYIQWRQIGYVDFGVGADLDSKSHIDLTLDYGLGHYRQNTAEDQFASPTSTNLAFGYNLDTLTAPLFTPVNQAFFSNPASYNQVYHLNEVDESKITQPVARIDFSHNFAPSDRGFGFSAGAQWKDATQVYSYYQYRLNPVLAPTLATMGALSNQIGFYDSYGQTLLAENVGAVDSYLAANTSNYTRFSGDALDNIINNYKLHEAIEDGYVEAGYRTRNFFALLGLRYESTQQKVQNYLPVPFNSTSNFVETTTPYNYDKVLPSLNVSYAPWTQILLRGAVTQTLARPEYSQLAENSSATVSGALASESVSNPNLKPRQSTNYDASIEWYPTPQTLLSFAFFVKDIRDEIVTLTTTEQNATVPGYTTPVALTITEPENVGKSGVQGVELNFVDARFGFLPGLLSGLGLRANLAFMTYDAPYIRMSDGTFRHLPQLTQSAHEVANVGLLYAYRAFSALLSYNHTGKQPISFDTNNAVNDQWWAAIDNVDFEAKYAILANADLRFSMKNLTDARPQKVVGPGQGLNYSALENGRAFFFGLGFRF